VVPLIESLRAKVIVFPTSKDILVGGVEVFGTMFVTIIVVVTASEAAINVDIVIVSAGLEASCIS